MAVATPPCIYIHTKNDVDITKMPKDHRAINQDRDAAVHTRARYLKAIRYAIFPFTRIRKFEGLNFTLVLASTFASPFLSRA